MKRLFYSADEFLRGSTWKDLALVKLCLFSLGFLFGTRVSRGRKLGARFLARLVFILTYIPLMGKYISVVMGMRREERSVRKAALSE